MLFPTVRPSILFFWFKCYNSLTCILFCFVDSVPNVASTISSTMNEHSSNEICLDHLYKSCTRGRPDGIPDLFRVPYHQDLFFISPFPLTPLGVEQSSFPGMFPKLGLLGEASILRVLVHIPEYSPDHSRNSES